MNYAVANQLRLCLLLNSLPFLYNSECKFLGRMYRLENPL